MGYSQNNIIIIFVGGGDGVISMHFRFFRMVKVQNGNIALNLLKFQIFLFGVNSKCWVQAYVASTIESTALEFGPRSGSTFSRS